MTTDRPLDAYSLIVSGVAEKLTPKVASLRVPRGSGSPGESLGSGVVYTGDGFLLTNAHVVGRAQGGTASFSDGTTAPFRVVGADHRPHRRRSGGRHRDRRAFPAARDPPHPPEPEAGPGPARPTGRHRPRPA